MRAKSPFILLLVLAFSAAGLAQAPAPDVPAAAASAAASRKPEPQLLVRVVFVATNAEMTAEMLAQVDAAAAGIPPAATDRRRIQILGFASGDLDLVSANRRLSLERALAVRDRLVARGIDKNRIDVRPLGTSRFGDAALDRVDVMLGTVAVPSPREVGK